MVGLDSQVSFQELPKLPYDDATGLEWEKGVDSDESTVRGLQLRVHTLTVGLEIPYVIDPATNKLALIQLGVSDDIDDEVDLSSHWKLSYYDAGHRSSGLLTIASIIERERKVGPVTVRANYYIDVANKDLRFTYASETDDELTEIFIGTNKNEGYDDTRVLESSIFHTNRITGDQIRFLFNSNGNLEDIEVKKTPIDRKPILENDINDPEEAGKRLGSLASIFIFGEHVDMTNQALVKELCRVYLGVTEKDGDFLRINSLVTLKTLLANMNAETSDAVISNPAGLVAYDPQSIEADIRALGT